MTSSGQSKLSSVADQYELDENSAKNEYNRIQQIQAPRYSSDPTNKSLSHIPFVKHSESIINNLQEYSADTAIFQSHRFRVNWSMNPTATTYTSLDFNLAMTNMPIVNLLSPSTVFSSNSSDSDASKLTCVRENCSKYLNIQLDLTNFIASSSNASRLPLLRPKAGNDLIKNFFECTQEIRNQIG